MDPFGSATELLAALAGRDLSSVEAVEVLLARVRQHDDALKAIVTVDEEGALGQAAVADRWIDRHHQIAPVLADGRTAEMADRLGYGDGSTTEVRAAAAAP